eukprot:838442-Amphidinium_carterae.1
MPFGCSPEAMAGDIVPRCTKPGSLPVSDKLDILAFLLNGARDKVCGSGAFYRKWRKPEATCLQGEHADKPSSVFIGHPNSKSNVLNKFKHKHYITKC